MARLQHHPASATFMLIEEKLQRGSVSFSGACHSFNQVLEALSSGGCANGLG
jgi:hypothetical protein